jgi:predicted permease
VTLYHEIIDAVGQVPGVISVAATNVLPLQAGLMNGAGVKIRSRPQTKDEVLPIARYKAVSADYFNVLGMTVLQGRAPIRADSEQDRSVVWVNETFARVFLDHYAVGERVKRAIGERFDIGGRTLEIIGVVSDAREFGLRDAAPPMAYLPLNIAGVPLDLMEVITQSSESPASLGQAVRAAVNRVKPSVPLTAVRTMGDVVRASQAQMTFTMTLLTIAACVALALGVIGVYGVTKYVVSQRHKEIGVRIALGAEGRDVRAMVLRQGLSASLAGIVVGIVAAYALTTFMASLLFEVSARDPAVFAIAPSILAIVSGVATYLPARRAARVDPLVALRYE